MDKERPLICIATSIHPDYDARIFRHARSVAQMGYEVDLICGWNPGTVRLPEGLRIVPFERVTGRAARAFLIPWRMLPLLLARPYALYHFHDLDVLWFFALLRLFRRRPVVYDCHEIYAEQMLRRHYLPPWSRRPLAWAVKWYERLWAGVVRNVVIVVPRQLQIFDSSRIRTVMVRNYAERSLEEGRRDDYDERPPGCIFLASQYVDNGGLLVLDVAREVLKRRLDVTFFIIDRFGDPALRSRVMSEIGAPDLAGRVVVLPNVLPPDIMRNLNQATIGLALGLSTPTQLYAIPTKLFEYMAAGLPIVASDLPSSREAVTDAACGLIVPPGDAAGFADAICSLVDDRVAAREMGRRGLRAFRARYNWEAEVDKLRGLYQDLIKPRPGQPTPDRPA